MGQLPQALTSGKGKAKIKVTTHGTCMISIMRKSEVSTAPSAQLHLCAPVVSKNINRNETVEQKKMSDHTWTSFLCRLIAVHFIWRHPCCWDLQKAKASVSRLNINFSNEQAFHFVETIHSIYKIRPSPRFPVFHLAACINPKVCF